MRALRCPKPTPFFVPLAICMLLASGCGKQDTKPAYTAIATCGSQMSFNSGEGLGYMNTPHFKIGQVFMINTANPPDAFPLGNLSPDDSQISKPSPAEASYEMTMDTGLNVTMGADVPNTVTIDAKSSITAQTTLTATNLRRVDMTNPIGLFNASPLAATAKNMASKNPLGLRVVAVASVLYADSLSLSAGNGASGSTNVNVVKIASGDISVTYKCDSALKVSGSGFGALYKVMFLMYDPTSNSFVPDMTKPYDLTKYDLTNTLM